jgi:hypothetical protein
MEPVSKYLRFYEYHTVGYTTLWDLMSTGHQSRAAGREGEREILHRRAEPCGRGGNPKHLADVKYQIEKNRGQKKRFS